MDLNGTGAQDWPLTTGNNDDPTLTQGKATSFFCNTIPDRCPTGPLAYYLPYVLLTIAGNLVQSGTAGSLVYWDQFLAALVFSIDWITAWHGTVVSANHVLGTNLPIFEYMAGGQRYALRRRPPFPAAAGTYPFEYTIAIPASSSRLGRLMGSTSQLALCYQTSQIKINVADSTVITALSAGATLTSLAARCSAKLVPSTELVLGTPIENIVHQTVAGANSPQIQIKGFGTDTLLNGVENKGGVVYLAEQTNVNNQGGVFAAENITQYAFPWRGQQQTYHPQAMVAGFEAAGVHSRPQAFPTVVVGGDSEYNSYPYANLKSDQPVASAANLNMDLSKLLAWEMVRGGNDLQLSDLQTADSDQSYFLTVNGGFSAGSHLIPAQYAKRWTQNMRDNWVRLITQGDNSLAAYVLRDRLAKAQMFQRKPAGKHTITDDQKTYLAWQLA